MIFNQNFDDLNRDHSKEENIEVAKNADIETQKKQFDLAFNYQSSVGCRECVWLRAMSDELKKYIEGKGCTVIKVESAWEDHPWKIEW